MKSSRPVIILTASIASLLAASPAAFAADWVGNTSADVNDVSNWNVNPSGQNIYFGILGNNGGPAPFRATLSANLAFPVVDIQVARGGGPAILNHTAGTAATGGGNWFDIGTEGGNGTYNLANTAGTGGTLTGFAQGSGSVTADRFYVGGVEFGGGGGTGVMNINTSGTVTASFRLIIGEQGTGTVNLDNGTINIANDFTVGFRNNGTNTGNGTFRMSGGTVNRTGGWTTFGRDGGSQGHFVMSGGTMNTTGGGQTIIGLNNATGTFTMTGGSYNADGEVWVGNDGGGNGTMTVSGGTLSVGNWFAVGRNSSTGVLTINGTGVVQKTDADGSLEITNGGSTTASGIVNLDGGSLIVNNITGSGGAGSTAILNLNGGTLKPTVADGNFISGNVVTRVKAGGAVIDTNGFGITIQKVLETDLVSTGGGLTKNGAGNLTLTATATYTGATTVNSGKLTLTPTGNIGASSGIILNGGRGVATAAATGQPALPGAVLFVDNGNGGASNALGTKTVTLNGGTLEYHGGASTTGLAVSEVNVATGGALASQPQEGGLLSGLLAVNNLTTNPGGTSTLGFVSTYGQLGENGAGSDTGHITVATVNGTPLATVINSQNGIIGGWATTYSSSANGGDTATHFATNGANGITAVTYTPETNINLTNATDNFRMGALGASLTASKTINALETDADLLIDNASTLTIATGGLILGGGSHWIQQGAGSGAAITAGALGGNKIFATVNDTGTDFRLNNVAVTNNGVTPVGFVKGGIGLLSLNGNNTYTGATTINSGTLKFSRVAALYNGVEASWTPANVTVNSGGTVAFNVGGGGEFTAGNVTTLLTNLRTINDNGLKADTAIGFDTTNAAGNSFTIADVITNSTGTGSGALGVTKLGANTLVLTGANTYSGGTVVSGGTLQASGSGTFGTATNAMTINGGATLNLNGANQRVGALNGSGSVVNNVSGTNSLTVNNDLASGSFAGVIANNGGTGGTLALIKAGAGVQILAGANTYTGTTTVNDGTLKAGVASVANTSGAFGINSAVVLANAGATTLDITGFDTQIGSLSGGGVGASSRVLLGAATLTTGGDNTSPAAYNGVISGAGALIKIGTGTQILNNSSNYSGGTTVNGGTLQLNFGSGAGTLGGNGPIVINSGGTVAAAAVDGLGFNNNDTNNGITINQGGSLVTLEGGRLSMDRSLTSIGGTLASVGTNFNEAASFAFRFQGEAADPVNSYNFTSSPSGVASTISATHIGVNGAVFNVTQGGGAVDLNVTGDMVDKFGTGGLTKAGNGVMVIANASNPLLTGPTTVTDGKLLISGNISASAVTVNGGTLGGSGGTVGTTTVNSGGTLAPGTTIGTLNFSGSLTLAGTAVFEINKTGLTLSADLANVTSGTLTLGGTLTVSLLPGDALTFGNTFNLFDAPAFTGTFATVNLPNPGAGLSWNTSNLAVDGTITVVPEPGTVVSLFGGIGLLLGLRRRRTH